MNNLNELYELIKDYKQILEITESKKNLQLINDFLEILLSYKNISYNDFKKSLKDLKLCTDSKKTSYNKAKSKKFDISKIVPIYKNFIKNKSLSSSDIELLDQFNNKYPNIKNITSLDKSELYQKIHSTPLKNFTLIELKFLLKYYFNTKISSKNTKKELYDELLNNIYQSNYLDSLKSNYSKANNNSK